MTVTTTRSPRGWVANAVNECTNPSFENDTAGWTFLWAGDSGTSTDTRLATQYANRGGYVLCKTWTKAPSSTAVMAGFQYQTAWSAGATKSVAAVMASIGHNQYVGIQITFLNGSGGSVGQYASTATAALNGGWAPVSLANITAPAGAVTANIQFGIMAGASLPVVNDQLWLDCVIITATTTVQPYFDGASPADANYSYSWSGTAGDSPSYRLVPDPSTIVSPYLVLGWDESAAANNVFHTLLSGVVVAVQRNAQLRSGTIKLFFTDRGAAMSARAAHQGAGTWQYVDSDLPETNMKYAVNGALHLFVDDLRKNWELDVPFQEVA